ncbi:hypothetical protein DRH27_00715 [Candidatus Falkowbacteria bacterium]|nr:MAG: hypothetical protein DRH27_00715 [Candidatus Falkowbacteria bacterium]
MSKKLFKNLVVVAMFLFLIAPAFVFVAHAQTDADLGLEYADQLGLANPDDPDPRQMAVNVVKYLMTFLGIIAVVVILIGGFQWMTAGGNEDKVASAKKMIIAGAIGLIIILAAYAIVQFVINTTGGLIEGDVL